MKISIPMRLIPMRQSNESGDYMSRKNELYEDLRRKVECDIYGIDADPSVFHALKVGKDVQEAIHYPYEYDYKAHPELLLPFAFTTPQGLRFEFHWNRTSPYALVCENGIYFLSYKGETLYPVRFQKRPRYYDKSGADGIPYRFIAQYGDDGGLLVTYNNNCALHAKNDQCRFCNINTVRREYAEAEKYIRRTPDMVAEAVAAAYEEGACRTSLTGGFLPERSELGHYAAVAEAVGRRIGNKPFHGRAIIGAPVDLGILDSYKDAGYELVSINIEFWDRNIFKALCPGKYKYCGGWAHWVEALEYAVNIFGFGRVASNLVAGIEPRESTLEGVRYLASKGIICLAGAWKSSRGSAFEGHRTPEPAWHYDLALQVAGIYKDAGFTYEHLYPIFSHPSLVYHDIYNIESGALDGMA